MDGFCNEHSGVCARLEGLCKKIDAKEELTKAKLETIDTKFEALDKALGVAKKETDRRLESMNHLQDQLNKQAAISINRTEHNDLIQRIDDKVVQLDKSMNEKMDLTLKPVNDKMKELTAFYNQKVGAKVWEVVIITAALSTFITLILKLVFKV